LQSLIDAELTYAVAYAVEQQLLTGDGTGNNLTGLIPAATAYSAPFTPTAPQQLDTLLLARAQLAAADLTATSVVLNPIDWFQMLTLKNSQENYLGQGPFGTGPDRIWGLDVVQSNSMPEDSFLMLAGRAATIYDRQDLTVEVSTEHADFWTRNLCAVRAETRLALAITQPEGLVLGDFGNVT
jgi:HK97 family phage major capsid protein